MSVQNTSSMRRLTMRDMQAHKNEAPIVCLTAHAASMARLLDPHCDMFIVGDSLGMVVYGFDSTLPVTMEMMLAHGKAVVDASEKACVVVDMPFGSYQESPEQAFANAATLVKETGCQCVKLEGGHEMVETVSFLSQRGLSVMAHIGLKPQYVQAMGGYRYQGRTNAEAEQLIQDAKAFETAGASALLLEGLDHAVATDITKVISVPTVGIGASNACDGQVLVTEDMLGISERIPKFVKTYAKTGDDINAAAEAFAKDVRSRDFPSEAHYYGKTS